MHLLLLLLSLCPSGMTHTSLSGQGSNHGHLGKDSCRHRTTQQFEKTQTDKTQPVCLKEAVCVVVLTSLR